MSNDNTGFKAIVFSALVAAAISAGGIGLFLANYPASMTPQSAQQTNAEPATKMPLSDLQKDAIAEIQTTLIDNNREKFEKLVRDYLIRNPEVLVEATGELERKQNQAQQQARMSAISENADEIYRSENPLLGGNPDGDVTIVEFSDYNCPYCRRAFEHLARLIESDDKVRVVLKEFPIFGKESEGAARVAIAAREQGRYFDVHSELLAMKGRANEQSALKIAEKLGLDMDRLREDMKSEEIGKIIEETRKLAESLGVQGTPFYLVGDRIVPGAPDDLFDILTQNVAEVREKGCTAKC